MAFKLDGKPLAVDVPFSITDENGDTYNYPANWLRLSTAEEKTALGITEVADDPVYDTRFYNGNGTAKELDGVKSELKEKEKITAGRLLAQYDWYVVRKSEKGTAIPTAISTYRDGVRTACDTRETEIDNCSTTSALVTLYGSTVKDGVNTPNMTQYPLDPNDTL